MSTVRGSLRGGSVGAPDVDLPAPLRKKMEERSGSDGGRSVDYKPSDRDPTLSRPPRPRIGQRASSSRVSAVVRAGCAAAALFAAFATGCGGHARTAGTILFQSDRSGRAAVYAVREDGSRLTKLLDLPEEAEVIWMRDGTKALVLAYPSYVFTP